jgi:hypothetical protein
MTDELLSYVVRAEIEELETGEQAEVAFQVRSTCPVLAVTIVQEIFMQGKPRAAYPKPLFKMRKISAQ